MNPQLIRFGTSEGAQTSIRWLYIGAIIFTVCNFGGVDALVQSLMTLILCALAVLKIGVHHNEKYLFRLWFTAVTCLFFFLVFTFLQSLRIDGNPYEHPAWKVVREHLGPVRGAISVAPGQTRASMVAFAPLLGFILSLSLFNSLPNALATLRRLIYFSAVLAIYGIVQVIFIPLRIDNSGRPIYADGLNAVFLNRNSAGAFFGVSAVMAASFTFYYLRSIGASRLCRSRFFLFDARDYSHRMFAVFGSLTMLEVVTLSMTKSRGAVGATFLAFLLLVCLVAQRQIIRGRTIALPTRLVGAIRVAALATLASCMFLLFAGQATYRMENEGLDHNRACGFKSTVAAIQDNWELGAGFGAFSNVFPAYRDATCRGTEKVWDAAHNSFLEGTLGIGISFPAILVAGLTILFDTFLIGIRIRRLHRFVPCMGLSVLFLVCLHSTVDFSIQIPGIGLYVATILGCCCVVALKSYGR